MTADAAERLTDALAARIEEGDHPSGLGSARPAPHSLDDVSEFDRVEAKDESSIANSNALVEGHGPSQIADRAGQRGHHDVVHDGDLVRSKSRTVNVYRRPPDTAAVAIARDVNLPDGRGKDR